MKSVKFAFWLRPVVMVGGMLSTALAAPKAAPKPPPVKLGSEPEATAVTAALEKSAFRFTSGVKAAYLAWSKARALAAIAAARQSIPQDFLDWVDSDPVVAATVYGLADDSAQRLVLLRSLELDVGAEQVRIKHNQLALCITDLYSGRVDPATMSDPELGISLQERGLLELKIPACPLVRVDTHPKDRPLDLNDHIINFLEENPVVPERKVTKVVDGKKVVEIEKLPARPAHAWEVMSSPALQEKFNGSMQAHGQDVSIDCGDSINPWSKKAGNIMKAYRMFKTAYEEKGLLPKQNDPAPTPGESLAYLVRIDEHRFPEGVKRGWPKFDLNSPFPVLRLLKYNMPLREREFIWARFRDQGIAQGYGSYLGKIAQYADFVAARRLQPFEFAYRTYPMMLKDGGVCGVMSTMGETVNAALGIPSCGASQPAHRCFMSIHGNREKGFGVSIGQSIAGPAQTGGYIPSLINLYPINYDFPAYLDARMAMRVHDLLPDTVSAEPRLPLLLSAVEINPYHQPAVNAVLSSLGSPGELVAFWKRLVKTLAAVDKPGCPKTGFYNDAVEAVLIKRLAALPVPENAQDRDEVMAYLAGRGDAVWLKYQLEIVGLLGLKAKLAEDLKASIAGERTPAGCLLLSNRITLAGGAIKPVDERRAWAAELLKTLDGHQLYTTGNGKSARHHTDVSELALRRLVGASTEARGEFLEDLKASVAGTRTPTSCKLLVERLEVIGRSLSNGKDRIAFGDALLAIIDGHEAFAPNPAKPASLALDPIVPVIYTLGGDLTKAKERFQTDLKAAVDGSRTPESCAILQARATMLGRYTRDNATRKAWAESLLPIVAGREAYLIAAKDPSKAREAADPCVATIYQLAGQKTPAQIAADEAKRKATAEK